MAQSIGTQTQDIKISFKFSTLLIWAFIPLLNLFVVEVFWYVNFWNIVCKKRMGNVAKSNLICFLSMVPAAALIVTVALLYNTLPADYLIIGGFFYLMMFLICFALIFPQKLVFKIFLKPSEYDKYNV